jgi:hypothetical protein
MKKSFIQAYRQAPWRVQLQKVVVFLLVLVVVALVAGMYLSITAQTTQSGVKIQKLEYDRDDLIITIANNRTKLALVTSQSQMKKRAQELGFESADMSKAEYMVIDAYPGRKIAGMTISEYQAPVIRPILKPSYTQSLWEWVLDRMVEVSKQRGGKAS